MKRILIIEDEQSIALGLKDDLELEGYEVEVRGDGESGIECVREGEFDLILLDVMLPGKDGYEVCRDLRLSGIDTPIIMLTAKGQETEKVLGLELGADDYITKPYSSFELRARIKVALRRGTERESEIYRFGDFEVDLVRFEVRRKGQPIEMTPLEFKLLVAFIRNRGRALSRDRLLDLAWGTDAFVTDRAVDTKVGNLRKKIEEDPSSPQYIVSVRGLGYRFDG